MKKPYRNFNDWDRLAHLPQIFTPDQHPKLYILTDEQKKSILSSPWFYIIGNGNIDWITMHIDAEIMPLYHYNLINWNRLDKIYEFLTIEKVSDPHLIHKKPFIHFGT